MTTCHWYDDCTFMYDAMEVRGTGNAYLLRLHAVSGLTYRFNSSLEHGAGMNARVGIFHEGSVGGASAAETVEDADFPLGRGLHGALAVCCVLLLALHRRERRHGPAAGGDGAPRLWLGV